MRGVHLRRAHAKRLKTLVLQLQLMRQRSAVVRTSGTHASLGVAAVSCVTISLVRT
jgi:hypothetical protein